MVKFDTHQVILQEPNVNLFCISYIHTGFHWPWIKKFLGMSFGESFCEYKDDKINWGVDVARWKKLGEHILEGLKSKKLDYNVLKTESARVGKETLVLTDQILNEDINAMSNTELAKYVLKLHTLSAELSCYGFIPVASDFHTFALSNEIQKILKSKIAEKNIGKNQNELIQVLISHTENSFTDEENKSILKIAKEVKALKNQKEAFKNKKVKELLTKHMKDFCWLAYGYQGPALTEKNYIEEVKSALSHFVDLDGQLNNLESSKAKLKKEQDTITISLGLNKDEQYIIEAARTFLYLKSYRMEIRHKSNYVADLLFKEITKRKNLTLREIRYCTPEEIETILMSGKKPENLKERMHYAVYTVNDMTSKILTGIKAKEYLVNILMKNDIKTDISRIHGQAASLGVARGYAKIVHNVKDISKVQEGDILVAVETIPDYVPAMKKAAAFVTEQGGITSHASIVAREMKKPCLIGTKIATKVFKDGDFLEVNVNEGYVAKINKET